jgi:predicted kinase
MEEETKAVAALFGRMNPITSGHEENVNGLKSLAAKYNADHVVIASHSHDPKKNPLSPEDKMKHLRRAFPGTNVKVATKQSPTILHHASDLHKQGYSHLIIAGGGDRADEYKRLLNQYNGKEGKHGFYNFKKITVASTGERKAGVSGTDMRNHIKNNDFHSFKQGLPSKIRSNDKHSMELFHDVKKGMNIHENHTRGMFKALFLVGGPGSGKDVIVREAIAEKNAVEINSNKAYDLLLDKKRLSEESKDYQLNAIRNRKALIINGASDDTDKIASIKEELDELGYTSMMVFVNTTNEVSSFRNKQHSRVISEDVRYDKWKKSQDNISYFYELFDFFMEFDNSANLQESNLLIKEQKENEISDIANEISYFFKSKDLNENAKDWLRINNKMDINKDIKSILGEQHGPHDNYTDIRKKNNGKSYTKLKAKNKNVLQAGNSYLDNFLRKSGKIDDVRDGDINKQNSYIFHTYEEKELQQESEPKLQINPEPKEPNFNKDKESPRFKKKAGVSLLPGKAVNVAGVGDTYDTRTQGTVYPMGGLGNTTYRESFENFRKKLNKESIDSPSTEMGTFGGVGNGVNKEPMVTPSDRVVTQVSPKKKIKEQEGAGETTSSLAKKHGVSVKSINKQIKLGTSVEHEHTKDNDKAKRIAMDHVAELPDYYTRLTKMEKQAKKQEKK